MKFAISDRQQSGKSSAPFNAGGLRSRGSADKRHEGNGRTLRLNSPGDTFEREADRLAGRAIRRADDEPVSPMAVTKPSFSTGSPLNGQVAQGISSLPGRGAALDSQTRFDMEKRFGRSFGDVRVHTDSRASELSQQLGAEAFTYGSEIAFKRGRYMPNTPYGRYVIAHELAHVMQQSGTAHHVFRLSPSLCASGGICGVPDAPGSGATPTSWKITLAVDREEKGLGRLKSGNVGHTWVKLSNSAGEKYSYGFWPQVGFNSRKPFSSVKGCVHHPDIAHEPPGATDYLDIDYSISAAKYASAIGHAETVCRTKPDYNLFTYNCTSFAIDVVKAAGANPPSSTTLAVHNPNALYEGIQEETKKRGATGSGTTGSKKTP